MSKQRKREIYAPNSSSRKRVDTFTRLRNAQPLTRHPFTRLRNSKTKLDITTRLLVTIGIPVYETPYRRPNIDPFPNEETPHRNLRLPDERGRLRSRGQRDEDGRLRTLRNPRRSRRRVSQHLLRARQCRAEDHSSSRSPPRPAQERTRTHLGCTRLHGRTRQRRPPGQAPCRPRGRPRRLSLPPRPHCAGRSGTKGHQHRPLAHRNLRRRDARTLLRIENLRPNASADRKSPVL